MFDRTANLANNQIINYKCDPSEKWLVLIGIAPGSPEVRNYYLFFAQLHLLEIDYNISGTNLIWKKLLSL